MQPGPDMHPLGHVTDEQPPKPMHATSQLQAVSQVTLVHDVPKQSMTHASAPHETSEQAPNPSQTRSSRVAGAGHVTVLQAPIAAHSTFAAPVPHWTSVHVISRVQSTSHAPAPQLTVPHAVELVQRTSQVEASPQWMMLRQELGPSQRTLHAPSPQKSSTSQLPKPRHRNSQSTPSGQTDCSGVPSSTHSGPSQLPGQTDAPSQTAARSAPTASPSAQTAIAAPGSRGALPDTAMTVATA